MINRFGKYPLMWVMLLWAVTLPGQEAEVYGFLLKGFATEASSEAVAVSPGSSETSGDQETGHVFWDAKVSSHIGLNLQQLFHHPILTHGFAAFVSGSFKVRAASPTGASLLMLLLPFILQPNAP